MRPLAALWLLLAGGAVQALPIVSVDMDPATPGIQDTLSLVAPTPTLLSVDLVISGVEAGQPLNGFELDLDFDPLVLQAVSVLDGGFLLAPVFQVQQQLGPGSVELAAVTLAAAGASGDGVLASILFETVGAGTSALDLNDVILSAPFGVEIPVAALNDGGVTVTRTTDPPAPIPEPSAALLFVAGSAVLSRRTRTRKLRETGGPS